MSDHRAVILPRVLAIDAKHDNISFSPIPPIHSEPTWAGRSARGERAGGRGTCDVSRGHWMVTLLCSLSETPTLGGALEILAAWKRCNLTALLGRAPGVCLARQHPRAAQRDRARDDREHRRHARPAVGGPSEPRKSGSKRLEDIERQHIRAVLEQAKSRIRGPLTRGVIVVGQLKAPGRA